MAYKTSLEPETKRANLCPSDLGKQWGTDQFRALSEFWQS